MLNEIIQNLLCFLYKKTLVSFFILCNFTFPLITRAFITKKTMWVFLYIKWSKFWSISLSANLLFVKSDITLYYSFRKQSDDYGLIGTLWVTLHVSRYIFSSNHHIQKSSHGLCFWASDAQIQRAWELIECWFDEKVGISNMSLILLTQCNR